MTNLNTTNGIVKTFNEHDFINEFKAFERMDNFSIKGLRILFNALEQMAIDCQINIEMDVIALCCEYSEDAIADIIDNYGLDVTDLASDDCIREAVEEYLLDNTFLCGSYEDEEHGKVFIYQAF